VSESSPLSYWDYDRGEPDRWTGPLVAVALTLTVLAILLLLVVLAQVLFDSLFMDPGRVD
jgi:hypothetical protein